MKLLKHAMVTAAVTGLMLGMVHPPSGATSIGQQGCTPGYWKNHTSNWFEDVRSNLIPTTTKLGTIYTATPSAHAAKTMLQGLSLQGGSGADGASQILLRAATAAYLNAAHEGLGYPLRRETVGSTTGLVPRVNAALASGDRAKMLALASELDKNNNLGCPLN